MSGLGIVGHRTGELMEGCCDPEEQLLPLSSMLAASVHTFLEHVLLEHM